MKKTNRCRQFLLLVLFALLFVAPAEAFSILAHEAIIDASWYKNVQPLLLKKYPTASEADLVKAHAYAYGGSLVADMGYIPGGSPYFTNLLHYVRSGDFIATLIAEARDLNEYAFALGALSHYWADKYGHEIATNPAVAKAFPKLKQKFGDTVTYDDDHTSHGQMELAYDVIQAYKGNYASTAYHHLIGFEMNAAVLDRALNKTYGQSLSEMFANFNAAVNKFRWGVTDLFPELARMAWQEDADGIAESFIKVQRGPFGEAMPQEAFAKSIKQVRSRGGIVARSLSFVITRLPKIGPLKKLSFKYPGAACEKLYLRSIDSIMYHYAADLRRIEGGTLALVNIDFDTGKRSAVNEYALADQAHHDWLLNLRGNNFNHITAAMRQEIVAFYQQPNQKKPLAGQIEKLVAEALSSGSMMAAK